MACTTQLSHSTIARIYSAQLINKQLFSLQTLSNRLMSNQRSSLDSPGTIRCSIAAGDCPHPMSETALVLPAFWTSPSSSGSICEIAWLSVGPCFPDSSWYIMFVGSVVCSLSASSDLDGGESRLVAILPFRSKPAFPNSNV